MIELLLALLVVLAPLPNGCPDEYPNSGTDGFCRNEYGVAAPIANGCPGDFPELRADEKCYNAAGNPWPSSCVRTCTPTPTPSPILTVTPTPSASIPPPTVTAMPGPLVGVLTFGGRFQVSVAAQGDVRAVQLSPSAGGFFFSPAAELVVTITDERARNGFWWVWWLARHATGYSWSLTVKDLATGAARFYSGTAQTSGKDSKAFR